MRRSTYSFYLVLPISICSQSPRLHAQGKEFDFRLRWPILAGKSSVNQIIVLSAGATRCDDLLIYSTSHCLFLVVPIPPRYTQRARI